MRLSSTQLSDHIEYQYMQYIHIVSICFENEMIFTFVSLNCTHFNKLNGISHQNEEKKNEYQFMNARSENEMHSFNSMNE